MAKNKISDASNIFSAPLFVIGKPTSDGRIFTKEILDRIMERLNTKPSIIIQEMNPVERKLKNISLAEPWDKKIMATVLSAQYIQNKLLVFTAECKSSRDGKMLAGMIAQHGLDNLDFFPVGYGTTNTNKVIEQYQLNYISVEVKK